MSNKIKVEFTLTLPDKKATDNEIQEWLDYRLCGSFNISDDNPLLEFTKILADARSVYFSTEE